MVELTIEQKAERYDAAIKRAKAKIKNDKDHVLYEDDVLEIFPELAEEYDEKIRKALIDGFTVMKESKNCGKTFSNRNIPVADILAWLEKQGEKEKFIKKELENIHGYREEALRRLHELEKQGEQKPAWSEEDNVNLRRALAFIKNTSLKDVDEIKESVLTWITSLKDRVQLQPKQEWNAKDKGLRDLALWCVNQKEASYDGELFSQQNFVDAKNWLKSLRPKSQWKPSNVQIDLISEAIGFFGAHSAKGMLMIDLRNNIKKLKD